MKHKSIFLSFIFGIFFLGLTVINTNLGQILGILSKLNLIPLFVGLTFFSIGLFFKTLRWSILLDRSVPKIMLFYILSIGYLINNLLPARLGELAKIYLVGKKEKAGVSRTIGTIFIEKFFDTINLLLMLGFFVIKFFRENHLQYLFLGIVISEKWDLRLKSFRKSFDIFKNREELFKVSLLTVLIWIIEAFWNYSILTSLHLEISLFAAFFLVVIINLGMFIPSPPGYVGVFHFLATFALIPWRVDKNHALSYAILQNGIEYLLLTSIGIWSASKISFNPFTEKLWRKN